MEQILRIQRCMDKASRGETVTLAFLGGSITQGSLATSPKKCYAYLVYEWWKTTFQNSNIIYVNSGIGGTSSYFGVARVEEDVLRYKPDFVVIDFSVNDDPSEFFQETYEGLIRRLMKNRIGILILNHVCYDTGCNAQWYHNEVGNYYNIPYVSMKDTLYRQMQEGHYTRDELTEDGLHPNDRGHQLVAAQVIRVLQKIQKERGNAFSIYKEINIDEKKPLTKNRYENTKRLNSRNSKPKLFGFQVDMEEQNGCSDCFKNGWIGEKIGDRIVFQIKAKSIAIQYRKTIKKPSNIAKVTIDNNESSSVILDGNFEENWGDCLYLQQIFLSETREEHSVEIEVIQGEKENRSPFYFASILYT